MRSAFSGLLGASQIWRPARAIQLFHGGARVTKFDLEHAEDANEPCVFFTVSREIAEDYANDWVTQVSARFGKVLMVTLAGWQLGTVRLARVAADGIDAVCVIGDPDADDELWRQDVYCVLNPRRLKITGAWQVS